MQSFRQMYHQARGCQRGHSAAADAAAPAEGAARAARNERAVSASSRFSAFRRAASAKRSAGGAHRKQAQDEMACSVGGIGGLGDGARARLCLPIIEGGLLFFALYKATLLPGLRLHTLRQDSHSRRACKQKLRVASVLCARAAAAAAARLRVFARAQSYARSSRSQSVLLCLSLSCQSVGSDAGNRPCARRAIAAFRRWRVRCGACVRYQAAGCPKTESDARLLWQKLRSDSELLSPHGRG
eukprot:129347-Chlamydomonas_euryale.AAC.3